MWLEREVFEFGVVLAMLLDGLIIFARCFLFSAVK